MRPILLCVALAAVPLASAAGALRAPKKATAHSIQTTLGAVMRKQAAADSIQTALGAVLRGDHAVQDADGLKHRLLGSDSYSYSYSCSDSYSYSYSYSYSHSYSYSYDDTPECILDCFDGNGSWDCDLLDTCLGDCEFPLLDDEDLPDEQALYDYLYTTFMCAAAEMAPAWCPDPSTFEGDAIWNPDGPDEPVSCSQVYTYLTSDWGVTPDGCSTEARCGDQMSETWLAEKAGNNCCGDGLTRDVCGGLLDMSLWCADTNEYDPDADLVGWSDGDGETISCKTGFTHFSMHGADPRRCSDETDVYDDKSDQDFALLAKQYCCGDDPETDVCDEDYVPPTPAPTDAVVANVATNDALEDKDGAGKVDPAAVIVGAVMLLLVA